MYFYAQLNENGICLGISQLSKPVNDPKAVPIQALDVDLIWRKYENGQWSVVKFEPETTAPLTEYEQLKARVSDLETIILMEAGVI